MNNKRGPSREDTKEKLQIVYNDIVGRLINDDNTCWKIITLSGLLLTLVAGAFRGQERGPTSWVMTVYVIVIIISLGFAIVAAFFSLSWHTMISENGIVECPLL